MPFIWIMLPDTFTTYYVNNVMPPLCRAPAISPDYFAPGRPAILSFHAILYSRRAPEQHKFLFTIEPTLLLVGMRDSHDMKSVRNYYAHMKLFQHAHFLDRR